MNENCKHKNCGCETPCGCGDNVLKTPPPCESDTPECENGDTCPETFSTTCDIYMRDSIANVGINKGDNMSDIIQKLTLLIVNPGCAYPDSACQAVYDLQSTKITATTIELKWGAVTPATAYEVEYRETTSGTWLLNGSTTDLKDTIGGLNSATSYYVRLKTTCAGGDCYSVTLLITTK